MWKIEYDNETGYNDEGFSEWWNVTNGDKYFRCGSPEDADWLCDLLNTRSRDATNIETTAQSNDKESRECRGRRP